MGINRIQIKISATNNFIKHGEEWYDFNYLNQFFRLD